MIGKVAATVAQRLLRHDHFIFFSFHEVPPVMIVADSVTDADCTQALHRLYQHIGMEIDTRTMNRMDVLVAERRAIHDAALASGTLSQGERP